MFKYYVVKGVSNSNCNVYVPLLLKQPHHHIQYANKEKLQSNVYAKKIVG